MPKKPHTPGSSVFQWLRHRPHELRVQNEFKRRVVAAEDASMRRGISC
jgi:hypothetical protein